MKSLSALNKYFWKYKWLLFLGIAFVIFTNYFRILTPQITGYVVNTVVQIMKGVSNAPDVSHYDPTVFRVLNYFNSLSFESKIMAACLILLGSAIISGIFMFFMRQTIIVMSRRIEFDQKNEIFAHYQSLDATFFKSNSTGDLMNRITEDVSKVRSYTGPAIMYLINLIVVILLSIYFMFHADAQLTLIALSPLPVLAITIYSVNSIINRKAERVQSLLSDLTTHAQESYSGIRVIKSFVQEASMLSFFKKNSEDYRSGALSMAKTEAIYFPSMALLIGLSTLLTILYGSIQVVNHEPHASVGKIAEFVMYIQMLTFPVSAIGWTASMIQRAATSQTRINEFLNTRALIEDAPDAMSHTIHGDIRFSQASFTYFNTGIPAMKNIDLHIKAGSKVAIVGRTGSGKTTLGQLLLRMYDLTSGDILIDGKSVREFSVSSLREQIGYVPQDVFLFSDSVKNNIRFGRPDASDDEVTKAAEMAGIAPEIENLPEKYDTLIGERGVTLSGGQKQRLSIARALLKNPEVLILDDCISAVDSRTEKRIAGSLNQFLKGKTAIIITHRILPGFEFDDIIVMEDGRIAEQGLHQELLQKNGLYTHLFSRQSQENQYKNGG